MKKLFLIIISSIFLIFSGLKAYYAAGVLPYAVDSSGNVKILLGSSSVHDDRFSDFGGLADAIDNDDSKVTAAREACEELMFIFDTDTNFKKLLSLRNRFKKHFDITKVGSQTYIYLMNALGGDCPHIINNRYVMYFVQIPYQEDIVQQFLGRKRIYTGHIPRCWDETVRLVWIDLDELIKIVNTKDKKFAHGILYKPFAKSFKMAYKQEILCALAL